MFKLLRGYGDHLQLSVFRCELGKRELIEVRSKLSAIIRGVFNSRDFSPSPASTAPLLR